MKFLFSKNNDINLNLKVLDEEFLDFEKNFQLIKTNKKEFYNNKIYNISVWESPEYIYKILKQSNLIQFPIYWLNIKEYPLICLVFNDNFMLFNRNNNLLTIEFPYSILYNFRYLPFIKNLNLTDNKDISTIIKENITPEIIFGFINKTDSEEEKYNIFKKYLIKYFNQQDNQTILNSFNQLNSTLKNNSQTDDMDKQLIKFKKLIKYYKTKNKFPNFKSFILKYKKNEIFKSIEKYIDMYKIYKNLN